MHSVPRLLAGRGGPSARRCGRRRKRHGRLRRKSGCSEHTLLEVDDALPWEGEDALHQRQLHHHLVHGVSTSWVELEVRTSE